MDFEDDLESLEDQLDQEEELIEDRDIDSFDDLEGDQWAERFGESYIEDPYDADELDDLELERLEDEFFRSGGKGSPPSPLDEIDDD